MTGRLIRGPAAGAEFDQAQAQALDNLRKAEGFLLVTAVLDGEEYEVYSLCAGRNVLDASAVLIHAGRAADDYLAELVDGLKGLGDAA